MLYKILGALGVGAAFFALCFMTMVLLTGSLLATVSDPTKPLLLPQKVIATQVVLCFAYSRTCNRVPEEIYEKFEFIFLYLETLEVCTSVSNRIVCDGTPLLAEANIREA